MKTPTKKQIEILRWLEENAGWQKPPYPFNGATQAMDKFLKLGFVVRKIKYGNRIMPTEYFHKITQAGINHLKELDNREEQGK